MDSGDYCHSRLDDGAAGDAMPPEQAVALVPTPAAPTREAFK